MRSRRALVLALALVLLPALALADHVYSHRVTVEGRLVDRAGLPMPNVTVSVLFGGDSFPDVCPTETPQAVTNAWGDFSFCFHKHAVAPNVTVTIRAGNLSESRPLDRELRKVVFLVQDLSSTSGVAPEAWNSTFRFEGRVWYRGGVNLDGVEVEGIAMTHAPVNLTFVGGPTDEAPRTTFTNDYGDFNGTFQIDPSLAPKLSARVDTHGVTVTAWPHLLFHRTVADVKFPVASAIFSGPPQPGTTDPKGDPLLIMASVIAATISFAWVSRKR